MKFLTMMKYSTRKIVCLHFCTTQMKSHLDQLEQEATTFFLPGFFLFDFEDSELVDNSRGVFFRQKSEDFSVKNNVVT